MKHIFKHIQTISVLLLSVFSTALSQTEFFHLSGKVADVTSLSELKDATIYLTNTLTNHTDSTITDISGQWQYDLAVTAINAETFYPDGFWLSQNYPNPFNPSTHLDLILPEAGIVSITVYDILGNVIEQNQRFMHAGSHQIEWNAQGSAGIYFMNIRLGKKSITRKMTLLDGGKGTGISIKSAGSGNRSLSASGLGKLSASVPVIITASKFGYMTHSAEAEISSSEYFEFLMETVHAHYRLADLHNDLLEVMIGQPGYHMADYHTYNHTDIPRMKLGGVDIQLFAVWVDPSDHGSDSYAFAQSMINLFNSELALNPSSIGQARTRNEAVNLNTGNKIAAVLAVEGGHTIENDIGKLKSLYQAGMRYLTITWNNSTEWAVSAQDNRSTTVGLSEFGKTVIRTLDTLGVLIDVSHTGIKTIQDILTVTKNPIIATHSGARALRNHYRNLYDDQIRAIANSGGVVGVVFYPPFLSSSGSADISRVVDHIDYIVKLVGIDFVALGSDFDGIGTNTVDGLEDISKYPGVTLELLRRGYTQNDIEKILGTNFLRVFEQVCGN